MVIKDTGANMNCCKVNDARLKAAYALGLQLITNKPFYHVKTHAEIMAVRYALEDRKDEIYDTGRN